MLKTYLLPAAVILLCVIWLPVTDYLGTKSILEKLGEQVAGTTDENEVTPGQILAEKLEVHYLLGYLRDQQQRHAEAADHYRHAVKLDPDYLNAWKKLLATAEEVPMTWAEREQIALAMFRLDPNKSHDLKFISDLRVLWDTLLEVEANLARPEKGPLYPLTVATLALAKNPTAKREAGYLERYASTAVNYREHLSKHPLIKATAELVQESLESGH